MPATTKTPLGASTTNRKWYLDVDTNYDIADFSATVDATADTFTKTAHGLLANEPVRFTGTLPAPLAAGTTYYVRDVTANTFKVSATVGGAAVDITAAGTVMVVPQPNWVGVFGMTDLVPTLDNTLQEDSDYDSDGYKSQTKTASQWSLTATVKRAVTTASPTAYDPGQEAIRLAGDQNGVANSVYVRWYEMEPAGPRVEAYEGLGAVSWSPNGGPMDSLSTVSFTITGQGKRIAVAHPTTTV